MQRIVKGIWVPIEIWESRELSWNEKILLMEIDSFTARGMDCYMSNERIAAILGIRETSANRVLSSLIKKGYVERTRFDGRRRYVRSLLSSGVPDALPDARQTYPEEQGSIDNSVKSDLSFVSTEYNKINNNISIQDIDITRESNATASPTPKDCMTEGIHEGTAAAAPRKKEKGSAEKERTPRFVAPTEAMVREYCAEHGYGNVDAQMFCAFYESKGWKVGNAPMKDWRAAVRTWMMRERRDGTRRSQPAPRRESAFEQTLRAMDRDFGTDWHGDIYGGGQHNGR